MEDTNHEMTSQAQESSESSQPLAPSSSLPALDPQDMPGSLRELLAQLDAEGITDYRRYLQVRRYLDFKARKVGVPFSGAFELTPLCNLDCKMCYVHLDAAQLHGAKLLPVETWKDLARQAMEAGMMCASITGGECLTYPGFKEFYLYLQSLGLETHILTNGVLMDEDMVSFLVENPPSFIQVTLYGASEEAYERVTGRRMFARVMENIRRLRDANMPLSIALTPNAFMTDGTQAVRLLHEEGFSFQINSGIIAPREETGRKLEDASLDAYVDMLKLKMELSGKPLAPECEPDEPTKDAEATDDVPRGVLCGAGRSAFSIDWRGNMRPCNTFPCEPADVLSLGFAESWKRTNRAALEYPRPIECEGCSYKSVCKGCVAEHASCAPRGHASKRSCAWGKRMLAEGLAKL